MSRLQIAPGLELDADYIGGGTLALLAKKGAGKSYTARVLAEEMWKAKIPFVFIDPMGTSWGLRAGADGDEAGGLPIPIFGGDKAGFVTYPGPGMVALTEKGENYAQPPPVPPTSRDIQDLVLAKLTGPQQKILGVLIDAYPEALDRADLASATGYSLSGTFAGYLSELSSLGLILYPSRGTAAADPVLFID